MQICIAFAQLCYNYFDAKLKSGILTLKNVFFAEFSGVILLFSQVCDPFATIL